MRKLLAVAAVALACGGPAAADTVRLAVANESAAHAVRCIAVLAHFFTEDLGEVAPGAVRGLAFERDGAAGGLVLRNAAGTAMYVENVICGRPGRWSETRTEVPLSAARSGRSVRVTCADDASGGLACVAATQAATER